ncbi:MAG: 4Fe-4S binding protein [Candidatus Saganbacteria bacterium]|nr:4Fe-4S binding protein [Candidatus Saganbacteria bacterium]
MEKRIFLNLDLCCGCRSCAAACSYYHFDQSYLSHGEVDSSASLPYHCQHCEDAPCVAACPNEAMKKSDEGVVERSHFKCVGCGSCALGCPFGVIAIPLKRHVSPKCNLCIERVESGKIPKCVASCTSGALSFEDLKETAKDEKKVLISGRFLSNHPFRRR